MGSISLGLVITERTKQHLSSLLHASRTHMLMTAFRNEHFGPRMEMERLKHTNHHAFH